MGGTGSGGTILVLTQGHMASETILIWKFVMFESGYSFGSVSVLCVLLAEW